MLLNAKLIIYVSQNLDYKIKTEKVFNNRATNYWNEEQIFERGIESFLDESDMKETLNWNLNGNSEKYIFEWIYNNDYLDHREGIAFIFD